MLYKELLTELKKKAAEVCEIQNVLSGYITQESNISQSHETDQIEGNRENLPHNTNDDQIQLNSIEFNRNQWMLIEFNEHQLISMEFNGVQ